MTLRSRSSPAIAARATTWNRYRRKGDLGLHVRRCCVVVVVVVLLTLLGLAVACGSGQTSARSAIVTVTGRIGPLHLDRSDRAAVIAFAGRPDAERGGHVEK